MLFSFRSYFLLTLFLVGSISANAQTDKERELANNALSYTESTISLLDSLIQFSNDFLEKNIENDQKDFSSLYAEMKFMNKHIKKGVKIANKLMNKMSKRDGTFTKKEFNAFEEIYLYERGQEDFFECYENIMRAEEKDNFESGMYSLISRLSKTQFYMKDYSRVLEDLLATK